MKKAYVKPVFFADEYELTASVANCGPVSIFTGWTIDDGDYICSKGTDEGHVYSHENLKGQYYSDNVTYYDYATRTDDQVVVFTIGNTVCDFMWDREKDKELIGTTQMYVWDSADKTGSVRENSVGTGFMKFFGNGNAPHSVGTYIEDTSYVPMS